MPQSRKKSDNLAAQKALSKRNDRVPKEAQTIEKLQASKTRNKRDKLKATNKSDKVVAPKERSKNDIDNSVASKAGKECVVVHVDDSSVTDHTLIGEVEVKLSNVSKVVEGNVVAENLPNWWIPCIPQRSP